MPEWDKVDSIPEAFNPAQEPLNRARAVDTTINNVEDELLVSDEKPFSVDLERIDNAVMFYIKNVIQPTVLENGEMVTVPVMYGSQEKWKSVQHDGFVRDRKGRIITPLIMFKRNAIAPDENIQLQKLDANNPQLFHTIEKKYSQKNRYDAFNVLNNQVPIKEYYHVIMPDYIIATYDVVLWTQYNTQMNTLAESMVFASKAYWGDKKDYRFRARVSDIATPIDVTNDADRTLKSTFTLSVNGYLVPDTINANLASQGNKIMKTMSAKKIVMFTEVDNIPAGTFEFGSTRPPTPLSTPGGGSVGDQGVVSILNYLNKQLAKKADTITVNTATFSNVTLASSPSTYPQSQENQENFQFFVNGQYIENNVVTSFAQVGSDAVLTVDSGSLGFSFEATDEIYAVGKFTS